MYIYIYIYTYTYTYTYTYIPLNSCYRNDQIENKLNPLLLKSDFLSGMGGGMLTDLLFCGTWLGQSYYNG